MKVQLCLAADVDLSDLSEQTWFKSWPSKHQKQMLAQELKVRKDKKLGPVSALLRKIQLGFTTPSVDIRLSNFELLHRVKLIDKPVVAISKYASMGGCHWVCGYEWLKDDSDSLKLVLGFLYSKYEHRWLFHSFLLNSQGIIEGTPRPETGDLYAGCILTQSEAKEQVASLLPEIEQFDFRVTKKMREKLK